MKIRYLGYNEVLDIYREQINKFGGFGAVRDNNALLSVIVNPQREFAGRELYPTIASKAAIVVYSLIKNHPFVDGNKRTAFIWGRTFLRLNGYDVGALQKYYEIIVKIAKDEVKQEDVFEWFEVSVALLSDIKEKVKEKNRC
ncbi:MAG: type II toxin-antitoxin system death-on-curing family toxin [Candidatus Omnitrophota bacterium]